MAWVDVKNGYFDNKMFWNSVLRRAVFDYVLYKGVKSQRRDWKWAKEYIFDGAYYDGGGDPDAWGLSFDHVCGLFGWDPEYLRRIAKTLTRSDIKKLESSKFRDLFVLDAAEFIISMVVRWSHGNPAPFMTRRQYSKDYRKPFILKSTPVAHCRARVPPLSWGAAA